MKNGVLRLMTYFTADLMTIFIDTGPFISYCSERDEYHEISKLIFEDIGKAAYGEPVTSDYILTEVSNFLFKKGRREDALRLGSKIIENYPVIHIEETLFANAWKRFNKLKIFSLTDCTNLAVMEHSKIDHIFTFDNAFKNFVKTIGLK